MRDLKADLIQIQATPTEWRELPQSIIIEYLERAIKAESQLAEHRSAISIIHDHVHHHHYSKFIDDVCDRILYAKNGGDAQ